MNSEPTFICVLWHTPGKVREPSKGFFDHTWADKLYRGVKANYDGPFKFVCLTDRMNAPFAKGIYPVSLIRDDQGWMNINEVFRSEVCTGRMIFMGLDTVITGDLSDIVAFDGEVAMPRNPWPKHTDDPCNAVVSYTPEIASKVWSHWLSFENEVKSDASLQFVGCPSEMLYWSKLLKGQITFFDDILPGQILSYKVQLKRPGARNGVRIVYFHGKNKPHEITDSFISEHWK